MDITAGTFTVTGLPAEHLPAGCQGRGEIR
jgi:hypothetical protein